MTLSRRYVEPFLGGGAVLLGLCSEANYIAGETVITPFVRWAGGKRQLYDTIRQRLRDLGLISASQLLGFYGADVNADLVAAWQSVRDDIEDVIAWLGDHWPASPDDYYAVRGLVEMSTRLDRGARMIYLNLFAFNGLYRVNASGVFNAPCDKGRIVKLKQDDIFLMLRRVSVMLNQMGPLSPDIANVDAITTLGQCSEGDVVYCDPPYVDTYTGYSVGGFDDGEQQKLTYAIADAVRRGARVLVSNSLAARQLYDTTLSSLPGYRVDVVSARRSGSGKASGRGVVEELLVSVGA